MSLSTIFTQMLVLPCRVSSYLLEPLSAKAEDNLFVFTRACEKIQIPRTCIATPADFKDHNVCVRTVFDYA